MHSKPIRPDVLTQILSEEFAVRFWIKVGIDSPDKCWIWKASFEPAGYGQMGFRMPDRQFHFSAHKLAWIIHNRSDVPNGLCVLHSCVSTRACCNPNHLRAGTPRDNMMDAINQGRNFQNQGVKHPNAKLTESKVIEIKNLHSTGNYTHNQLASLFEIGHTRVWEIVTGKAWKHISNQ